MARARYIICAKDRLVDQASGLTSHINVIDRLHIAQVKTAFPDGVKIAVMRFPTIQIILTAVWSKGAEDSESDEFEYETILHKPHAESLTTHQGEFRFVKKNQRIDSGISIMSDSQFPASGELVLESRIRKRGTSDWLSQTFTLDIDVTSVEAPAIDAAPTECANQT